MAVGEADQALKEAELAAKQSELDEAQEREAMKAPGVLRVTVISAAGLMAGDKDGKSDAYAKVYLAAQPEVTKKTKVIKDTLDPVWNETFDFHGTLAEMMSAPIEVELSDQDLGGITKTALGKAVVPFGKEVARAAAHPLSASVDTQGTLNITASFAPLKLIHSSEMYIKHKGVSSARYFKHGVRLEKAEGPGGWNAYRLMYKDNKDNDHNSTVVGLTDRADMRYEFTILTHEAGAYSVRCESSKDYKDWTSTIASLVPPPLSGAPEVDEEGVVKTKKMSIFRKKSTKGM